MKRMLLVFVSLWFVHAQGAASARTQPKTEAVAQQMVSFPAFVESEKEPLPSMHLKDCMHTFEHEEAHDWHFRQGAWQGIKQTQSNVPVFVGHTWFFAAKNKKTADCLHLHLNSGRSLANAFNETKNKWGVDELPNADLWRLVGAYIHFRFGLPDMPTRLNITSVKKLVFGCDNSKGLWAEQLNRSHDYKYAVALSERSGMQKIACVKELIERKQFEQADKQLQLQKNRNSTLGVTVGLLCLDAEPWVAEIDRYVQQWMERKENERRMKKQEEEAFRELHLYHQQQVPQESCDCLIQ